MAQCFLSFDVVPSSQTIDLHERYVPYGRRKLFQPCFSSDEKDALRDSFSKYGSFLQMGIWDLSTCQSGPGRQWSGFVHPMRVCLLSCRYDSSLRRVEGSQRRRERRTQLCRDWQLALSCEEILPITDAVVSCHTVRYHASQRRAPSAHDSTLGLQRERKRSKLHPEHHLPLQTKTLRTRRTLERAHHLVRVAEPLFILSRWITLVLCEA